MRVQNITVQEMKARNRQSGFYLFANKDIRIEQSPDWLGYFITSERSANKQDADRYYAIRKFDYVSGRIDTISAWYPNKQEAQEKLKRIKAEQTRWK